LLSQFLNIRLNQLIVFFDGFLELRYITAILLNHIEDYEDYAKDKKLLEIAMNDKAQSK